MSKLQQFQLCDATAVPADAAKHYYPITTSDGVANVGPFDQMVFLVGTAAAPAGGINMVFGVQVSHDGTNWYDAYIHNIAAAADKWTLAATVTIVAQTAAALFALSAAAPYVRLSVQNNATNALAITVWAIAKT